MRLGISSHAFAWAAGIPGYPAPPVPLTPESLLQKAVRLGVRVVQIADNLPLHRLDSSDLAALARSAARLQIDLEVGTSGIEPDHLRRYLQFAAQLRSPIVRTLLDTEDFEPTPAQVADRLRHVLPEFERAGICLAIENHDRWTAKMLAVLLEACGSPWVGVCLDTANSLGCGEGLDTLLHVLGGWVVNLHIKDYGAERLPHKKGFVIEGRPAGRGLLDLPRLLEQLRSYGRGPSAILELWVSPAATTLESVEIENAWAEQSIRYLRKFIPD